MGEIKARTRGISRTWVIALSAVALLMTAAVVTVKIANHSRSPQSVAEAYYEALATGDAVAASSFLAHSYLPEDSSRLLTPEVLANATELISDVSVAPVDAWPGDSLEVSYTLAGKRYTDLVSAVKGDTRFGFLDSYLISPPDPIVVSPWPESDLSFSISGVPWVNGNPQVHLFPAVYSITATDTTYFDVKEDTLVVTSSEHPPRVEFVPTPELGLEVEAAVRAELDRCVAEVDSAAGVPECPLSYPLDRDTRGTWQVLDYPTVTHLSEVGQASFVLDGGKVRFTPDDGGDPVEIPHGVRYRVIAEVEDGELRMQISS